MDKELAQVRERYPSWVIGYPRLASTAFWQNVPESGTVTHAVDLRSPSGDVTTVHVRSAREVEQILQDIIADEGGTGRDQVSDPPE